MKTHSNRRRKKLIEPRIQLVFAVTFLATTAISVLTQVVVQSYAMTRLATKLPHDSWTLNQHAPESLVWSCVITFLLIAPLTFSVGILLTHRFVGPLYRFHVYLTMLANGERPGPCKLRNGDHLQDLCALLNIVTAPLQRDPDEGEGAAASEEPAPVLTSEAFSTDDPSEPTV